MGSPVFFIQKRPGRNEKIFTLIKLRTMQNFKDEKGIHNKNKYIKNIMRNLKGIKN
jgi:lipopolysaccharide/colanic/teichoic acid biosynthesis glycosyltransferase